MGIISWIILGGLAGWIASIFMKTDAQMGIVANIVVGIIGAVIGGFAVSLLGGSDPMTGFNVFSLLVAVMGSVILLAIIRLFRGKATV